MAVKKDKVNLTYDALWFKIFMDSLDVVFYGKEIFVSPGIAGREDIFNQLIGNVGGYPRETDFNKEVDVVLISDKLLAKFKEGYKDQFFVDIENKINEPSTAYRKLKFTTEELFLDFIKTRADGHIRQNKKDLKSKDNSAELNKAILDDISKDEVMLGMIKKYKDSTKEPKQQNLF